MIQDEFNDLVGNVVSRTLEVLESKQKHYTNDDKLHNIRNAASIQGVTLPKAIGGMMSKHTISIYDLIKSDCPDIEVWEEKITDHINYLILLEIAVKYSRGKY